MATHRLALLATLLALTACAPTAAPPLMPGTVEPPARALLALGDVDDPAASVASAFARSVERRFEPGAPLAGSARELAQIGFRCNAPAADAGEPPAQACRRQLDAGDCRHTWQVFLYAEGEALSRSRGLYDRACGGDRLLGAAG